MSHLCGNGMIEMLELLEDIPQIEYNLPDSEGNTPLHLAAQAGHVDVVSFLLNKIRTIVIDPVNNFGFSPLMKAAMQGRIKCSKLLLFSGKLATFIGVLRAHAEWIERTERGGKLRFNEMGMRAGGRADGDSSKKKELVRRDEGRVREFSCRAN